MTPNGYDAPLQRIADYVCAPLTPSQEAMDTARLCLADALGCALLALQFPACTKLLGPVIPDTIVPLGCPLPGTAWILDPIAAAFNLGTMIRWLDYNDTWLAAEWGHPSDNLGGLLAIADYVCRHQHRKLTVEELLHALIKAYEIQGVLALQNSFNALGMDHVILVRIATTAVATHLLGGSRDQVLAALSNAWIDGAPLRCYRHAPNTGSRKSWAAGDATSRGVFLALQTLKGEMGYPQALTTPRWGFYDAFFRARPFVFNRTFGYYVVENILFKISYPAEFHAQTAVEAAIHLHPEVSERFDQIQRIEIATQESAKRIIDKSGPLYNPADRDHCLQYMVAIGLLFGDLRAEHYENTTAKDKRIDSLRQKMRVVENPDYSQDYLDPNKRSIANAVQVFFRDGTSTDRMEVEYPIGHRFRRAQGIPLLFEKLQRNFSTRFSRRETEALLALFQNPKQLHALPVSAFLDLFAKGEPSGHNAPGHGPKWTRMDPNEPKWT